MRSPDEMALALCLTPCPPGVDPSTWGWLRQGLATYLRGAPLDDALNLRRSRIDRDAHIRRAAGYLGGSPYQRATAIVDALRHLRMADPGCPGPVATHLRLAERCWRLPRSVKQYARILAR